MSKRRHRKEDRAVEDALMCYPSKYRMDILVQARKMFGSPRLLGRAIHEAALRRNVVPWPRCGECRRAVPKGSWRTAGRVWTHRQTQEGEE